MGSNGTPEKLNEAALDSRERKLLARKDRLDELEEEIRRREKELKAKDAKRKQIILRLPESLWKDIARWSDEDFRSINGQIEYLLTRCVREHYK
jgi:hypothetical protein